MADPRHTDRRPRPLLRTVIGEVLRRRRQEQLAEVRQDLTAGRATVLRLDPARSRRAAGPSARPTRSGEVMLLAA